MSIQAFCEAVSKLKSEAGKEHLAHQLCSYAKNATALVEVAGLLQHANPVVAGNALFVIEAAHMGEATFLSAAIFKVIGRADVFNIPQGALNFALTTTIDAALNGSEHAGAALLTFVQQSSQHRTRYQHRLALVPAAWRKHRNLKQINKIAEGHA